MCFHQAAGAAHGSILVPALDQTQPNNFGGLVLGKWEQGEPVRVVPLDSLGLARCNFIKVDVEGMEEDVLRGAVEIISRCKPILYVENDDSEKSDSLVRFIDSQGYSMHLHWPPMFNPHNFLGHSEDVFDIVSKNMICLPPGMNPEMRGFGPVEVPKTE